MSSTSDRPDLRRRLGHERDRLLLQSAQLATRSSPIADKAGNVRPFTLPTRTISRRTNYFQRPERQYRFNAFAHYDVFPNVRVYGEFDFSNNTTNAQIAPGGEFFQGRTRSTNDNPLLSQSFKDAFGITPANASPPIYIGRRNVEGGGRQQDITLEDYRYVLGAKGDLFDNTWNYNFWWQSATNRLQQIQQNFSRQTKIDNALDVVTDPATGQPACASFVNGSDPACVPYDVFHLGGVTPGRARLPHHTRASRTDNVAEPGRIPGGFRPR